ncbi:MAG: hypothetical protein ACYSWX_03785 [Planctomycetota bacterium]|jgi:hypothetical protein
MILRALEHPATAFLVALVGTFSIATAPAVATQKSEPVATDSRASNVPEGSADEAAELWTRLTEGMRDPKTRDRRIDAFEIEFQLRARQGVQTNDLDVEARFLAPDFVAFTDAVGRQVALGPEGPWLEERDGQIVRMQGRSYQQDRRDLARIRNLARNYLSLADPEGIRIDSLRVLDGTPPQLPRIKGLMPRRLDWLELVTPDFGVISAPPRERETQTPEGSPPAPPGPPGPSADSEEQAPPGPDAEPEPEAEREPRFLVYIGCDESARPVLVVIRSAEVLPPDQLIEHCIHLEELRRARHTRALLLPWVMHVYERWPAAEGFERFPEVPGQAIYVRRAQIDDLELTPDSFKAPTR